MPAFVRRRASFTMRQRLTPARACSTTIRPLATAWLSSRSPRLSSCRRGFFGLVGHHPRRLIALKAGVLIKRGIGRIHNAGLIHGFLIVGFARHSRPQVEDLAARLVDQHDILVGMGLLLATVMGALPGRILGALPPPLRPIQRQLRGTVL